MNETIEERNLRLDLNRLRIDSLRASETSNERNTRVEKQRLRSAAARTALRSRPLDFYRAAFRYDNEINYSLLSCVIIGSMNKICKALKFKNEKPGMCCANGKVKLPDLISPPEPLLSLVSGVTSESKHFLINVRMYNACFQMTSYGATKIMNDHYMPTFKIQGQIYHRAGSLLPSSDGEHKFLQIYFMGNEIEQVNQRCSISTGTRREIVGSLQILFNEHNLLIRLFKTALKRMPRDDYRIIIRADKTPVGQHKGRYNAPTMNEVAIVVVGDQCACRDIVIHRRNDKLERISETHRSYDALQYPIIFWQGEDGYHFNIKLKNPITKEYIHLRDAIITDRDVNQIGKAVILPSTFTGSPRHMHEYAQDAMTYVRSYGCPDLFITFTCNPSWDEIKDLLHDGQSPADRHDIIARVFKQKLKSLMDFIIKHKIFGRVRCWMYSIEWQKRGLPHAHILIWLIDQIDDVISAQIPDSDVDPELFEIIMKNMIHGPCGRFNKDSPCMSDGKCTKRYPKDLTAETMTGSDGYPKYRRRSTEDNGKSFMLKVKGNDIEVDNRWIVPYPPILSRAYKAHINVEYCNSVKSIKYICKYINKGSDMAVIEIEKNSAPIDEIHQYQAGRLISSNEAIWRILGFEIHERHPTVLHLAVHLENGQRVYFTPDNAQQRAVDPPKTTLTEFFALCQRDSFAKTLLYSEVPKYYTWDKTAKKFERRKQGIRIEGHTNLFASDALGRLYTVHPNNFECYYLRMLLINVRGPTSFQSLKTVDEQMCATYRQACENLHLLENDAQWDLSLEDASNTGHPHQIRGLFAVILTTCFPSNPQNLWEKYKDFMSDDILFRLRTSTGNFELQFTFQIYNEALIMIEDKCVAITNKTLIQLGMEATDRTTEGIHDNDLRREQCYDINELDAYIQSNLPKLKTEQMNVYRTIMQAVENKTGGLYFLDAPGGTGKTFLISLILSTIRSKNGIALALASSGIAATLLDGGRTAHSALKLPLNLHITEAPTCNISKNSAMGEILRICDIISWDECTMAHFKALDALDRTLKDLRGKLLPFGGALILLSGDFRQTLPVIPRSTPADEIHACLKSSHLWKCVKKLQLITNMRVELQNDPSATRFAKQLLDIGNGNIPIDASTKCIPFPPNFCNLITSKEDLIQCVFPNIIQNYKEHKWLSERAILAAKNIDVDEFNLSIEYKLPGEFITYKSIDNVMNQDDAVNYPTEFLNSLNLPGIPPHELKLKIGVPVILIRNINPPRLCNGTRLAVKKLMNNLIEATIITGKYKGENVLLPRIPLMPTDMPFEFKRIQFPIKLAFAMTINKA
ncbi:uncharacterized protein LOC129574268 [Sitodiplosis mosellana]|uniref:uncharacterized protein LOC129574268 n=1 Tax=Sitodiplosis mosellana TaxID=263140 RepID=UPI002443F0BE|nr:uncharacterized protein LOC129574268 [Sitodiplosis mosellana]